MVSLIVSLFSPGPPKIKKAVKPTPILTLRRAQKAARKYLDYVYIGNVLNSEYSSTYCPKCKKVMIERVFYSPKIKTLKCSCGHVLAGVWK